MDRSNPFADTIRMHGQAAYNYTTRSSTSGRSSSLTRPMQKCGEAAQPGACASVGRGCNNGPATGAYQQETGEEEKV